MNDNGSKRNRHRNLGDVLYSPLDRRNIARPPDSCDHEKLAGILRTIKGRFILSYNDYPDIWRLYDGFQFKHVEGRYSIQRKDRRVFFGELIITNFEP